MISETFVPRLFAGQGVLVTGAAGGIGAGIARAFADLGARVIATDIDCGRLEAQVRAASDLCGKMTAVAGDLSITSSHLPGSKLGISRCLAGLPFLAEGRQGDAGA